MNKPDILITNILEARLLNETFDHVITAGPEPREVRFDHPSHLIVPFHDTLRLDWEGATEQDIAVILDWASDKKDESILIHCHAGMSRSTSTAIGILASWGYAEEEAWNIVKRSRPAQALATSRSFIPNPLVLSHVDSLLGTQFVALDERHERMLDSGYFPATWGE